MMYDEMSLLQNSSRSIGETIEREWNHCSWLELSIYEKDSDYYTDFEASNASIATETLLGDGVDQEGAVSTSSQQPDKPGNHEALSSKKRKPRSWKTTLFGRLRFTRHHKTFENL
jgi:hypothetical protein